MSKRNLKKEVEKRIDKNKRGCGINKNKEKKELIKIKKMTNL